MKKIVIFILVMVLCLSSCSFGNSSINLPEPSIDSSGFPTKYSKERDKLISILFNMGNGTPITISDGKFVEDIHDNNEYLYYGEMKGTSPNGFGVVCKYSDLSDYDPMDYLVFGGEFKKGEPCGYGVIFEYNSKRDNRFVICEADDCSLSSVLNLSYHFTASGDGFIYYRFINVDFRYDEYGNFIIERSTKNPVILYAGTIKDNERNGLGIEYKYDEYNDRITLAYKGEFEDNQYFGNGVKYFENGNIEYKGSFKKDEFHGKGVLYNSDESIKHKGQFKNGQIK